MPVQYLVRKALWPGIGGTLLLAAAGLSCSGRDSTSPVQVANLSVLPASATPLEPNATLQLTATAFDAAGDTLMGAAVSWTSGNAQVATVSAKGLVTAVEAGSTTIVATASGHSASIPVTVNQPIARISVLEAPAVMGVGGAVLLYGNVADANGNTLPGQTVTWTSSNPAVATVAVAGPFNANLTGIAAGTVTVTATCNGVSGTASVSVVAGGVVASLTVAPVTVAFENATPQQGLPSATGPTQLGTKLMDASNDALSGFPITWSSSDPTVATVSATGLVTPNLAVTKSSFATITATSEGVSGQSSITVNPLVAMIKVTPSSANIAVGDSILLVASAYDANGNALQGVPVGWGNDNQRKTRLVPAGLDSVWVIGTLAGNDVVVVADEASGATARADIGVTSSFADVVSLPAVRSTGAVFHSFSVVPHR
jgi:uncharacterized protein YjdB